jgi:hypothetical protein
MLADCIARTGWGYPWWSLPLLLAFAAEPSQSIEWLLLPCVLSHGNREHGRNFE